MTPQFLCVQCNKETDVLDRGMYRKFVSRTEEKFLCLHCLADKFKIPEDIFREKAEFLRKNCALFY